MLEEELARLDKAEAYILKRMGGKVQNAIKFVWKRYEIRAKMLSQVCQN